MQSTLFFHFKNADLDENAEVPAREGQGYFSMSLKNTLEKVGTKTEVDTSGMLFSSWKLEGAGRSPKVC